MKEKNKTSSQSHGAFMIHFYNSFTYTRFKLLPVMPSLKFTRKSSKTFVTSSILSAMIVILYLTLFRGEEINYTALYNTYNPATFGNRPATSLDNNNHHQHQQNKIQLSPAEASFHDEELHQRINNDLNHHCSISTFFNDEKIRKLTSEEQSFHKTMLRKWIMLYNSLGFKINILHYNDAVANPKLADLIDKNILFNKKKQINENYLKLLAWDQRKISNGLYSDYTIFPMVSSMTQLDDLKYKCDSLQGLTKFEGFEYRLFQAGENSIGDLLHNLIGSLETKSTISSSFNDLFADYSLKTMGRLLHSSNIKSLSTKIPKILNTHLKSYRLLNKFDKINIIDPLSVPGHALARSSFALFQKLTHCEPTMMPPPTLQFLEKFEEQISEKFPDEKITVESSVEHIQKMDKLLDVLYGSLNFGRGKCNGDLKIHIDNSLVHDEKGLNLVFVPHPLSTISVLDMHNRKIMNGEEISRFKEVDFLSGQLMMNFKKEELFRLIKGERTNYIFLNSELSDEQVILDQLSILLGFDLELPETTEKSVQPVVYDTSTLLSKVLNYEMKVLSKESLTQKLAKAHNIVLGYDLPMPFILNARQSEEKLLEMRDDLKKLNKKEKTNDHAVILGTERFEARHDPVVDISENFNKLDASIWHLVKNVRYVSTCTFRGLSSILASTTSK